MHWTISVNGLDDIRAIIGACPLAFVFMPGFAGNFNVFRSLDIFTVLFCTHFTVHFSLYTLLISLALRCTHSLMMAYLSHILYCTGIHLTMTFHLEGFTEAAH